MGFVMKKGQWLTHEGGEHYARAIRDIPYHSPIMASDFEMTHGGHPIPSSAIPEDVIRYDDSGNMHVNIDGEWNDLGPRTENRDATQSIEPAFPVASTNLQRN